MKDLPKTFNNLKEAFLTGLALLLLLGQTQGVWASSHREAPMIAQDPQADITDVYAFVSPDDPNKVTMIMNVIPQELPFGGPNYFTFDENVRYELHVRNDPTAPDDNIIYRFNFDRENEDPTTFFNIRLGMQNLKTTYSVEKSINGGPYTNILTDGIVPPNNIGPRSIDSPVGLDTNYDALVNDAIQTATTGEQVFAGPRDDPFFVDLGGIFDLGDAPAQGRGACDQLAGKNVHSIAIQVPINMLQKDGMDLSQATSILDPNFVIGVWASTSRPRIQTLSTDGSAPTQSAEYTQIQRMGNPLINEVFIPIGDKDTYSLTSPVTEGGIFYAYFTNPELALYMDDDQFGGAVPAFNPLRVPRNALGQYDFGNGGDGFFGEFGNPTHAGTPLDPGLGGFVYLPGPGDPRSLDLVAIFATGIINAPPFQIDAGTKNGDPILPGKPIIHNYIPFDDYLRLNMATPVTQRDDPAFSNQGLLNVINQIYNDPALQNNNLEFIPNMDGFPNGRRLEDDVVDITLKIAAGVYLGAMGFGFDDYDPAVHVNPYTGNMQNILNYSEGVDQNDRPFDNAFPYLANPHAGIN